MEKNTEKTQNNAENLMNDSKNTDFEENIAKNESEKKEVKWTNEQLQAIQERDKNLLVSASAGSGKTTVMTQRIINLVYKNKIPISEFLIVTFTSASAQDMKSKIVDKLLSLPQDDFVLEQIDNVSTSDISDLHSFYSRLIATYFYEIQIDPNYRIIDETESSYLKEKAISRVFENMEKQDNSNYYRLFDIFQKGRKDDNLKESVFSLSNFLASHIDGDKWFNENIDKVYNEDIESNVCAKTIRKYFIQTVDDYIEKVEEYLKICSDCECLYNYFNDLIFNLRGFSQKETFVKFAELLLEFKLDRKPTVKEEAHKCYNEQANALIAYIKARLEDYKKYIQTSNIDIISNQIKQIKTDLRMLYDLTKQYEKVYDSLKKEKGGLDFNDLERYALKILSNQKICDAVKSKYKFVFVDEYQDINEVQEAIISMVSSSNNRFMVGDLKQSIYRFRLCDPEIFLEKYNLYEKDGVDSKVIKLNCNFRSDKKILKFADEVFSRFMTKKFGGIDYQKDAIFVPGEDNLDEPQSVNLCLIDTGAKSKAEVLRDTVYSVENHIESDEEVKGCIAEARYIAQKIAEIIETQEKLNKPVTFSDFAILIFARNNKVLRMTDELKKLGIPVSEDSKNDIVEKPHIQEILNFIRYCFNQRDDYLAFNVLKSKLFNFTDNEIAEIRKNNFSVDFYDAVFDFEKLANDSLKEKLINFKINVKRFKELSKIMNIKDFCKLIISEFKLDKLNLINENVRLFNEEIDRFVSELPNISTIEFLVNYENFSFNGGIESGEDAVQIMTVHKSKGMEFKFVFVVNTSGNINYTSLNESLIMNKHFMVGMNYFDSVARMEFPSIPMGVCKIIEKRKIAEEQLRVFYVALTRAKWKLFVLCSKDANSLKPEIKNLPLEYSNWLEPIIIEKLVNPQNEEYSYINFESYKVEDFWVDKDFDTKKIILSKFDIEKTGEYPYQFLNSIKIPLKNSVSKILKNNQNYKTLELGKEDIDDKFELDEEYFNNEFLKSSAERGTIYHKFFEKVDFYSLDNLESQLDKIFSDSKEKDMIDLDVCKKILSNKFFEDIKNMRILKEREFFAEVPATLLDKNAYDGDKIIMQGIIDLCAISDEDVFVLDYKTGKFSEEKLEKYKFQLDVYSKICEKAIGRSVTKKFICFIDEQKLVEI